MRRLYLRDCTPGDVIEDVYVITNKQLSATTTGKYFIKAFLSDRTGQVTARMWNATRDLFSALPESGFLRIRGRVENYQNNLQFIIEQLWPAKEGTFDVADLMPHTSRDIDEMCQQLFHLCGSIQNRHLHALVQAYLDDEDLMNSFCKAPAAMNFHHAFIGGLLEHTLNAMEVADAVCKFYPALNRDVVVAGIFLHDIAKTWELSYDCAFGYTDGGQLVGHIVKSAIWVEQKATRAEEMIGEPIPQQLIDVLQHIVLSHHGLPEFGAARVPSTPEAIAVHVIENLDAKLMMALSVTRGSAMPGGEGNWTEYMKAFSGRLYRPDAAPAVDPEPAPESDGQAEVDQPASAHDAPGRRAAPLSAERGTGPQPGSGGQQPRPLGAQRNGGYHRPSPQQTGRPQIAPNYQRAPSPQNPPRQQHAPDEPRSQGAQQTVLPTPPQAEVKNGSAPEPAHSGGEEMKLVPGGKISINNPLFETVPTRKK